MTNQEIFDKAYIGLASQGFQKCSKNEKCLYSDGKGNHCAWGWVDTSLGSDINYSVGTLYNKKIGIAGSIIDKEQLLFVEILQNYHDRSENPQQMKELLIQLAKKYNLLIPDVV